MIFVACFSITTYKKLNYKKACVERKPYSLEEKMDLHKFALSTKNVAKVQKYEELI